MGPPMPRVAELAHVKAPPPPAPAPAFAGGAAAGVRVAWHGGKISSNKAEALRKFKERKQRAGDLASLERIRATQSRLGISLEEGDAAHAGKHTKKLHATHRPRAKAQGSGAHKTIVVNGRVVGPKMAAGKANSKQQKPQLTASSKRGGKRGKLAGASDDRIALETQLDLPLDALVKRGWS